MRRLWRIPLLATVFLRCSLINEPSVCTSAGCETGLWLDFTAMPVGAYRVEVRVRNTPTEPVYTFECGPQCPSSAWFPGLIIGEGYVRVISTSGVREKAIRPKYETRKPNGQNCPPTCEVAVVTVEL